MFWDSLTATEQHPPFCFCFCWEMTLKLSIKLVLSCLVSHLVNKFKVSNFDWHDWRTVAWVWPDLNNLKAVFLTWLQTTPPFSPIDWNVLQDRLHAVIDYQKDLISFHNSYLKISWVNLEVFPTLGTHYGIKSVFFQFANWATDFHDQLAQSKSKSNWASGRLAISCTEKLP